jgi:hypothetical protein
VRYWKDAIDNFGACDEGLNYCNEHKTFKEAWDNCRNHEWMEWLLSQLNLAHTRYCDHIDKATEDAFRKKNAIWAEADTDYDNATSEARIEYEKAQRLHVNLCGEDYKEVMRPFEEKFDEIVDPAYIIFKTSREDAYVEYTQFYANAIREYYPAEVIEKALSSLK